ncbi:MAG: hypothetical protein M1383_02090 [Patescibacteria group bacterium]|nr:hypothetical protein [Patescibacteria group bacterium]
MNKTINLLPKSRQQELKYELVLHGLVMAIYLSIASFALVFLVQGAARLYLLQQDKVVQAEIEQLKKEENKGAYAGVKAQIQTLNNVITDYKNLAENSPKWSQVLKAFAPLPPPGIKINTMVINVSKKTITITGTSLTRELVIRLYDIIRQHDGEFYNIDYPLENVVKPANITFHFTFNIRDSLIK